MNYISEPLDVKQRQQKPWNAKYKSDEMKCCYINSESHQNHFSDFPSLHASRESYGNGGKYLSQLNERTCMWLQRQQKIEHYTAHKYSLDFRNVIMCWDNWINNLSISTLISSSYSESIVLADITNRSIYGFLTSPFQLNKMVGSGV